MSRWVLLGVSVGLAASAAQAQGPAAPAADDSQFEAALPPLDQTEAPPVELAPPVPAATPVAPDPELAQPLPPIAGFDVTPPPPRPAQTEEAEANPLHYVWSVEGLKAIGLEGDFKSFSALAKGSKKAANAAQVAARADEDVKLAERLMKSQGFYDGAASASVSPVSATRPQVTVAIVATPGPRYALGGIAITGAAPEPTALATAALGFKAGDPIVASVIENGEAEVALRLPEQAYPFVTVGQRDVLLDGATHRGDYSLPLTVGRKGRFGKLATTGDAIFTLDHLNVFPRFDQGEFYDSRKVDDLRQALIGTSLFSTISVEPVATGTVNPDGTEQVDLLVRQVKGPWRSLAAQAGYATGEGATLTGSWTNRNLFPQEGALILSATAGTLQQGVGATFRRQNAGQRDRTFQAGLTINRQRFDAYDAETADLLVTLSRASTPIWQKVWTWSLGAELLASRERQFTPQAGVPDATNYIIAALPLQIGYDRSDSLLNPTKGYRLSARVSPEAQEQLDNGGGFGGYVRLQLDGSVYHPLTKSIVLAARARLGSIFGIARDEIAPSRRLYAGGGGSVRGFGYQELGPKDAEDNPVGGRSLTEFGLEARYRFGNFGVVPFIDAGRVGEGSAPSLSGMRYGAGIGGRYYTNFGPMRLDIATPIARQPGESLISVYISIGQAF